MIKRWALIKNGIIINTIVSNDSFLDLIRSDYDFIINTALYSPCPSCGWLYDSSLDTFSAPIIEEG